MSSSVPIPALVKNAKYEEIGNRGFASASSRDQRKSSGRAGSRVM